MPRLAMLDEGIQVVVTRPLGSGLWTVGLVRKRRLQVLLKLTGGISCRDAVQGLRRDPLEMRAEEIKESACIIGVDDVNRRILVL
jgi:selenophosphate synthase